MSPLVERPPLLLQICRERVVPGAEDAYKAIEEDAARICADLGCPNVHLAMESFAEPKEVWWLTPYESEADRQRVANGYATNRALMAALGDIAARKQGLVAAPIDVVAEYRGELSERGAWRIRRTRFFVATVTRAPDDALVCGAVFDADDGSRFVFRPASTRGEAVRAAADAHGLPTTTFVVRPYWGMAAKDWVAADPEFWKPNPRSAFV
jgi:hypothetical protein